MKSIEPAEGPLLVFASKPQHRAIDLLPAVLVLIVAVAQAAIRAGREDSDIADVMTVAELRTAIETLKQVEDVKLPEAASVAEPVLKSTPRAVE